MRVRFAGRDLDGFVVERRAHAEHPGRLADVRRVVSPEPVLTPEVLALCRAVADRNAGVLGDVLRLAVPKRHAAAERALDKSGSAHALPASPPPNRDRGPHTPPARRSCAASPPVRRPAAAWLALPGRTADQDWPAALAVAAATAVAAGRGALVVVPDHRDVDRVDRALTALLGPGQHVRLTADQGPQARYTAWLKVLRGHVRCVVGTRAAAFAPLHDLGLVAWWDDGDDLLDEPRAPYPHVRDVLTLARRPDAARPWSPGVRPQRPGPAARRGGRARRGAAARPTSVRAAAPRVLVAGDDLDRAGPAALARLPPLAWRTAKAALENGPVLVQVPRRGYLPSLACQHCREPARCAALPRTDGYAGRRLGADLPVVRCDLRAAGLRLPGVRRPRAAVDGGRRPPHGRGARPRLPRRPGPNLRLGRGARRGRSRTGARHRHPRRRTGRRGRLRGDAPPRRLGPARPVRPRRRRRGAPPLAGRGGPDPARPGRRRRGPGRYPDAYDDPRGRGAGPLGPRLARLPRARRAGRAGAAAGRDDGPGGRTPRAARRGGGRGRPPRDGRAPRAAPVPATELTDLADRRPDARPGAPARTPRPARSISRGTSPRCGPSARPARSRSRSRYGWTWPTVRAEP